MRSLNRSRKVGLLLLTIGLVCGSTHLAAEEVHVLSKFSHEKYWKEAQEASLPHVTTNLVSFLHDSEEAIREKALEYIAGTATEEELPFYRKLLFEGDSYQARAALKIIGRLGTEQDIPLITSNFKRIPFSQKPEEIPLCLKELYIRNPAASDDPPPGLVPLMIWYTTADYYLYAGRTDILYKVLFDRINRTSLEQLTTLYSSALFYFEYRDWVSSLALPLGARLDDQLRKKLLDEYLKLLDQQTEKLGSESKSEFPRIDNTRSFQVILAWNVGSDLCDRFLDLYRTTGNELWLLLAAENPNPLQKEYFQGLYTYSNTVERVYGLRALYRLDPEQMAKTLNEDVKNGTVENPDLAIEALSLRYLSSGSQNDLNGLASYYIHVLDKANAPEQQVLARAFNRSLITPLPLRPSEVLQKSLKQENLTDSQIALLTSMGWSTPANDPSIPDLYKNLMSREISQENYKNLRSLLENMPKRYSLYTALEDWK